MGYLGLQTQEVEDINSSYEQSKVLQYLIKNQKAEDLDLNAMLKVISQISSSYEQGKVLKLLVAEYDLDSQQIKAMAGAAAERNRYDDGYKEQFRYQQNEDLRGQNEQLIQQHRELVIILK